MSLRRTRVRRRGRSSEMTGAFGRALRANEVERVVAKIAEIGSCMTGLLGTTKTTPTRID
jgi:hypothetical protein